VLPLRGHSMHPTVRDGDRVVLRAARAGELREGTIAACFHPGLLVLHRIIKREGSDFIFDGDNATFPQRVPQAMVLGIAEARIPSGTGVPEALEVIPWERLSPTGRSKWRAIASRLFHTIRSALAFR